METRSVCSILFLLLVWIPILVGRDLPSAEVLEDRLAKILADAEVEQRAALQTLDDQFLRRLEVLRAGFEKTGDENAVNAVRLMQKAIAGDAPAAPGGTWPAGVEEAQRIYDETRTSLIRSGEHKALVLRGALVRRLEIIGAEFTAKGEVQQAWRVQRRIQLYALNDEELNAAGIGRVKFFGAEVDVARVVFIVDFSGSMSQGLRLPMLKKELDQALRTLPPRVSYNVIYYSHRPWLSGENVGSAPFRDASDDRDRLPWRVANAANVKQSREQLANMQIGGATNWIPPLRLALAMAPVPEAICLITDGEASDAEELLLELGTLNPDQVPIHTCAMEVGGPVFKLIIKLAEKTGGKFSIVHGGVLHVGEKARRFTGEEFAPEK
ncbi:MAG: hypothetical protein ACI8XO_000683 [Verrucomicrobiales bacterium]|jgi:hypothetical protein